MDKSKGITVSLNEEDKEKMEEICDNSHITLNDAYNLFTKKTIKDKALPFEINEEDVTDDDSPLLDDDEAWL